MIVKLIIINIGKALKECTFIEACNINFFNEVIEFNITNEESGQFKKKIEL